MFHLTDTFLSLMHWLIWGSRIVVSFLMGGFGITVWMRRDRFTAKSSLVGNAFAPWRESFYFALGALIFVGLWAVSSALPTLSRPSSRIIVGTVLVVLLSASLFLLKVKLPKIYALTELLFALVVCVSSLKSMHDDVQPVELLALGSAAYLFIRGMDNFRKALAKPENAGSPRA